MNSKTWIKKGLTVCLTVAISATYSMVALAAQGSAVGDLTVTGKSNVTVNGETAQSGRTIFSSSSVKTSETSSATLNLGKLGKIEVAPNSTFNLNVTDKGVTGDLVEGKVTSLVSDVTVTANGKTTKIGAGESVLSGAKGGDDQRDSNGNCVDTDKDGKLECDDATAGGWWIWTLVFGGAVAGILFATLRNNNRVALGGGTTVVSPSR
jgi:hypothetical protein